MTPNSFWFRLELKIRNWFRRRRKPKTKLTLLHGTKGVGKTQPIYKHPKVSELKIGECLRVTFFRMKVLDEQDPILKKYKKMKEGNL